MAFLAAYRRVLSRPGTAAFSASGFLGRLPISMVTLGIVLLVSARTDSYGLAGATSAAYVIALSVASIAQGRLIDRVGQRRVLLGAMTVTTLSLVGLVLAVEAGQRAPLPQVLAALAGATQPAVGAAVRARWTHALADAGQRQTAFALEAVVDECVFVVGPPLATFLSTGVDPAAGLVATIAVGVVGTLAFTALRATEPPSHRREPGTRVVPMPWLLLLPVVLVSFALGGLFGSTEVVTVAFAQEQGHPGAAGLLLACWSFGSLVAGLVSGALTWRSRPAVRMRWGLLSLTALMAPAPLVGHLGVMGVLLVLAGFAISPTLIASVSYVEQTVPAARLTEGIAVITTALGAGLAPGAALGGTVIDHAGASTAYLVAVGSGLVGVASAFATRPRRSVPSRDEPRHPGGDPPDGRDLDELVGPGDRTPLA